MRFNRKWVSILLIWAIVIVVAGCSKSNESASGKGNSDSKADGQPVKIEYFQQKPEVVDLVNELIRTFQDRHPNIIVEQNNVPNPWSVWQMRLATSDLPPVFINFPDSDGFKAGAVNGSVLDLTGDPLLDNVEPSVLEFTKIEGKNYLIPIALSTFGVYYNTDLFKELNLKIPTTYDELIAAAKVIQGAGKTPFLFADKDNVLLPSASLLGLRVPNAEQVLADVMLGHAHLTNNSDFKRFAEQELEMRSYAEKDSVGLSRDDLVRKFANGDAAMYFDGIWSIASVKAANPELKFSMFPMPADQAENTKVQVAVDTGIGFPTGGKYEKQAKTFAAFMTEKEIVEKYVNSSYAIPAIKGIESNLVEVQSLNDLIIEGKTYMPLYSKWLPGAMDAFIAAHQKLILSKDADHYLKELDQVFYGVLAQ